MSNLPPGPPTGTPAPKQGFVANFSTPDWLQVGAGALAFIASFLPWYSVDFKGGDKAVLGDYSVSASGWEVSFGGWFPILLLIAAAGLVVALRAAVRIPPKAGGVLPLVQLAAPALAFLIILIRWVSFPDSDFPGVESGAGFGLFLGLIAAILGAVGAVLALRASGKSVGDITQQFRTA